MENVPRNHVKIAQTSPVAPYTNTVHTDRTRHHLCSVHRAGRSTPSPPSSVFSDADADTVVELVPLAPSQLPSWSARGRGNLRVNLSAVLQAENRSGRLSLMAVGIGTCSAPTGDARGRDRGWERRAGATALAQEVGVDLYE